MCPQPLALIKRHLMALRRDSWHNAKRQAVRRGWPIGTVLLDLAVTHELGHAICQDTNERHADDFGHALLAPKRPEIGAAGRNGTLALSGCLFSAVKHCGISESCDRRANSIARCI